MTLIQIIVLALIQGLTEFLPVSSSAHLILGSKVFGWPDQGLVFDVATHLGTLVAVLIYFRHELLGMIQAWMGPALNDTDRHNRAMTVYLAVASIPALAAGVLLHDAVELHLRDVHVIAWATIGFGLLLWLADARSPRQGGLGQINLRAAFLIGLAQAFALIPGASRSGVTITAGRFLGLSSQAAARFSFLLAIPIIGAAGSYGALRVLSGDTDINWTEFALAMLLSAVAGWVCIAAFLALLKRIGLLPFIIYRLALGLVLLWY
jgi:undecaprenyl-diphosphatase